MRARLERLVRETGLELIELDIQLRMPRLELEPVSRELARTAS
jgi:hypothetical protein